MPQARMSATILAGLLLLSSGLAGAAQTLAKTLIVEHPVIHDLEPVADKGEKWPRLHSLLVSQGGQVVYERYFNSHRPNELENVKSVSKSVLSALIGIAIHRGDLRGLDVTLGEFFDMELQAVDDPEKARISLENLLTMQSGLRSTSIENYGAWVASDNWVSAALESPLVAEPGEDMVYSTGNTHLLSAILTRATGQSTFDFAREVLADPMGFELAPWPRDPQGIYFGGNDMALTPRQLLQLGELYLQNGRMGDQQIIPAEWVEASLAPRAKSPQGDARYYGYGWWVTELMGHTVPHAWGHGGQFIMLVPDLDLVLVSTSAGDADSDANNHANNVFRMLQQVIQTFDRHAARSRMTRASQRIPVTTFK
jgi:CubicO group peptidase (beta-lactamase class C family)